jgi:opacity protein-like surface antigen
MKKTFIVTALAIFSITVAQAQMSIGAKAGLNISNVKNTYDGGSTKGDARLSGHLGVYLVYNFQENMAFQPELVFSGEGTRTEFGSEDVKFNLTYLNLPLLFRYNFSDKLSAHTGPQIGFLLSAKQKYDGDTDDVKDGLKGTNVAWAIGGAYELANNVNVGLRYNIGLSDIADDGDSDIKTKVSTFQITVGYTFYRK